MNRNRQLSNVYWRNAKPYLNLQSTQLSINSTNKWVSFKSNTGNFIFNGSLAGCSVQLQFEFLWGDELSPSSYSHATSKSPIEAIASLKQVSVKRRLRTADSRLRTRGTMKTECKVCSPHCILHPACVLLSVCNQHFTLSLHFTPGPHSAFYTDFSQTLLESNWTHTDPVYLTFTWENLKFQLKKIKWFASIRLRSFLKKGLWFEATQFFYSF